MFEVTILESEAVISPGNGGLFSKNNSKIQIYGTFSKGTIREPGRQAQR